MVQGIQSGIIFRGRKQRSFTLGRICRTKIHLFWILSLFKNKMNLRNLLIVIVCLTCNKNVYAQKGNEINHAPFACKIDTGFNLTGRYDRGFGFGGGAGINAAVTLNELFYISLSAGYEKQMPVSNIQLVAAVNSDFSFIPFRVFKYIHPHFFYYISCLPEYDFSANSFIPALGFWGERGGLIVGWHIRRTDFLGNAVYENMLTFKAFWTPFRGKWGHFRVEWANFDDSSAASSGAWFAALSGAYTLSSKVSLAAWLAFLQSGGSGLAANFYGIYIKTGIRFSW
jgi:hypothetical protein